MGEHFQEMGVLRSRTGRVLELSWGLSEVGFIGAGLGGSVGTGLGSAWEVVLGGQQGGVGVTGVEVLV